MAFVNSIIPSLLAIFVSVSVALLDPIVRLQYQCVNGCFPVRMEVPAIMWILDTFAAVHCHLVVKTALKVCIVLVGMGEMVALEDSLYD